METKTNKLTQLQLAAIVTSLLGLIIFTAGASLVNAQETTQFDELRAKREALKEDRVENYEQNKAERTEAMEEKKQERQEAITERKAALSEAAHTRITNLAANISNRLDAITDRLLQITDRVEARVQKLEEKGVDTTAAMQSINEARAHIDNAKNLLATIDQTVATVTEGNDPRAAWTAAKEVFSQIRLELKAAHQSLRDSVQALKEAVKAAREVTEPITTSEIE